MTDETPITPCDEGTYVLGVERIGWVRKLTSRKFWLAVVGFITPLCLAFGASEEAVTQVGAIVMAGATLIAYVIGEGLVDSADAKGTHTSVDIVHDEPMGGE